MLTKSRVLMYYKRREVQEAFIEHARNKEVGLRFGQIFGKRPDVLSYPQEILDLTLQSLAPVDWKAEQALSFHSSEELWENPLRLSTGQSRKELAELRIGWDLVLDIDCKILDYSKICADLIVQFLRHCEVKDFSVKFSGNKGFHIGIPFEAFPKEVQGLPAKNIFPEAPRKIAFYVKENIKEELGRRILAFEQGNFSAVKEKVHLPNEELIYFSENQFGDKIPFLKVDKFLEIDTVLLASRHLYRMPYSLHEKSGLVSLPISPEKILSFEKSWAEPEKVSPPLQPFLSRTVSGESARRLLLQALDFEIKFSEKTEARKSNPEELIIQSPITEEFFPPCMKRICQGLEDGKKRGLFCLLNFLGKVGWSKPEIEKFVLQWNKEKNREPLREVYIRGQLAHFTPGERLPPNCDNDAYYKSIGIACSPDEHCKRLKNPVNCTLVKWKRWRREQEELKEKKSRKKEDH